MTQILNNAQNPNDQMTKTKEKDKRKKEKRKKCFEHLDFGHLNLFRI